MQEGRRILEERDGLLVWSSRELWKPHRGYQPCHSQAADAMHDIKPVLEELQTELRALYGDRLMRLVLYGSYARGTATEDSDVDVMVVLRGEVDPVEENRRMGSILADLVLKHGELVSAMAVAESRYASGDTPLLINVHREGLPI